MNGAESLVRTLIASDVNLCFANPGTSEMHLVYEIGRTPGVRAVLCLQENTVSGAADGYARMAGKPAFTLLHASVVGYFVRQKRGPSTAADVVIPALGTVTTIWVIVESGTLAKVVAGAWLGVGLVVMSRSWSRESDA